MANEKRLIDANALDFDFPVTDDLIEMGIEMVRARVVTAPTVDAVEVPCRCKECKYWRHYDHLGCTEFVKVCTLANYMIGENGYCLYGEKMDGGNEE